VGSAAIQEFKDCAQVKDAGLDDGLHPIDMMRNGKTADVWCQDGWALLVRAAITNCQAHFNGGEVGNVGSIKPDQGNTAKFNDEDIRAYNDRSTYNGQTSFHMFSSCNNQHMYCSTKCPFVATASIGQTSGQEPCFICGNSFENAAALQRPNHGTRGMGLHYGGGNFGYQRHPEEGNNCGFKDDSCGSGDGQLWVL
jgi:hypothetical protein